MPPAEGQSSELYLRRLTRLEEVFTHLEQTVQTLDQVIRQQQRALQQVELTLSRLHRQVEYLRAGEDAQRDPRAEQPPHY